MTAGTEDWSCSWGRTILILLLRSSGGPCYRRGIAGFFQETSVCMGCMYSIWGCFESDSTSLHRKSIKPTTKSSFSFFFSCFHEHVFSTTLALSTPLGLGYQRATDSMATTTVHQQGVTAVTSARSRTCDHRGVVVRIPPVMMLPSTRSSLIS